MSTQIFVDGPDAHGHCANCGADLSVIRMSACCEAPTHNALPEPPKSDAFVAGYAWMGRRCDNVLSARSYNLTGDTCPPRFGAGRRATLCWGAGVLIWAWAKGSAPAEVRRLFRHGQPAAAFQAWSNAASGADIRDHDLATWPDLPDFQEGARRCHQDAVSALTSENRRPEANAVDAISSPGVATLVREGVLIVRRAWETGGVPSAIMKIFFRGDALRGLAALSAYDTVHPLGFRDGVEAMKDLIGGSFDALRPRHRDPKTLVQAYDAGHHDATASDLAAVNAARTALLNTKGG